MHMIIDLGVRLREVRRPVGFQAIKQRAELAVFSLVGHGRISSHKKNGGLE
jgi:hypothetical protein